MAKSTKSKTCNQCAPGSKKTIFHKILTAEGWRRMLSGKSKSKKR